VGRSDSYRFEFLAQPGWSKRAARYDVGLAAVTQSRPAHTSTSPSGSPSPAPHTLPSSALGGNSNSTPYRHTRYDAASRITSIIRENDDIIYYGYDAVGNRTWQNRKDDESYYEHHAANVLTRGRIEIKDAEFSPE